MSDSDSDCSFDNTIPVYTDEPKFTEYNDYKNTTKSDDYSDSDSDNYSTTSSEYDSDSSDSEAQSK
jgi:hypothetical protein